MSFTALFALLVGIIVVGLVFWLCWWALGALALPEPFNKVAQVVIIVAALAFVLIYLAPRLLALGGAS